MSAIRRWCHAIHESGEAGTTLVEAVVAAGLLGLLILGLSILSGNVAHSMRLARAAHDAQDLAEELRARISCSSTIAMVGNACAGRSLDSPLPIDLADDIGNILATGTHGPIPVSNDLTGAASCSDDGNFWAFQVLITNPATGEPKRVFKDLAFRCPKIDNTQCWVAISGGYIGNGTYGGTFPGTLSGNPVAPGEIFDTVGGRYLAARATAYVYGDTGGEMNLAVDTTLDAVAVPPGMRAVVMSAGGMVVLDRTGPAFVLSSEYGTSYPWPDTIAWYRAHETDYPAWMREILDPVLWIPERQPIQPGRSVLVSAVEGGPCDY